MHISSLRQALVENLIDLISIKSGLSNEVLNWAVKFWKKLLFET